MSPPEASTLLGVNAMLINRRRLTAEFLGTLILVLGVVGSGIMAANLRPNDVGLPLLQNALATAGVLFVIITIFMPVSGASFNPIAHWRQPLSAASTDARC